ncbi:MAG TPA: 5'/3'-nucleotidase SurE [Nitrospiria bacterium]|nr:5'/3'-nucleotidase SurE [Nitrospiria bacterium]
MLILVTNDDGVQSPGLKALSRALKRLGEVWVVAPDRERSAAGHSLTLHKPLRVHREGPREVSVNGTPTDCVNLAVNQILKRRPHVVVSGINMGANLGDDVTYSGTVSAAMEGTILGIPSIALSQLGDISFRFDAASRVAGRLVRWVHRNGLPPDTLLNVNIPNLSPVKIKGIRVTKLGKRIFDPNTIIEKKDPRGRTYYWIGGNRLQWEAGRDTDNAAINDGMVSITPVHLDLTNYAALTSVRGLESRWKAQRQRKKKTVKRKKK